MKNESFKNHLNYWNPQLIDLVKVYFEAACEGSSVFIILKGLRYSANYFVK